MNASQIIGVLAILVGQLPARADDPTPDWLPPLPRFPFWELAVPKQEVKPSDDFTNLLLNRTLTQSESPTLPNAGRLSLSRETTFFQSVSWLSSTESPDSRELREIPALARDWKSDHSLKLPLPVNESIFMFGQYNTGGDIDHAQNKVTGRTGVGWKWSPFTGGEVQVRTGSLITYADDSLTKPTERSQLSVELQAKFALLGPLQVQYAGEALPAMVQADRNTVLQDLKLALPFGDNREVNVGAKYRWDDSFSPTPWMQRAELYLGLRFQR